MSHLLTGFIGLAYRYGPLVGWRLEGEDGTDRAPSSAPRSNDAPQRLRGRARELLRRLRGQADDHHAPYDSAWIATLPFGSGTPPEKVAALVSTGPWGPARLYRPRDVEWATLTTLPP